MMTIFVKKRAALTFSKLLTSTIKSKEEVQLPVCDAVAPIAHERRRFIRLILISTLSQFETRYKMVLILTFGLFQLVLASTDKLHANDHSKVQMQHVTGLKLSKDQSQNVTTIHARANI